MIEIIVIFIMLILLIPYSILMYVIIKGSADTIINPAMETKRQKRADKKVIKTTDNTLTHGGRGI